MYTWIQSKHKRVKGLKLFFSLIWFSIIGLMSRMVFFIWDDWLSQNSSNEIQENKLSSFNKHNWHKKLINLEIFCTTSVCLTSQSQSGESWEEEAFLGVPLRDILFWKQSQLHIRDSLKLLRSQGHMWDLGCWAFRASLSSKFCNLSFWSLFGWQIEHFLGIYPSRSTSNFWLIKK